MYVSDERRDRPAPVRPVLFWAQVLGVPLIALVVVGYLLGSRAVWLVPAALDMAPGTAVALAVAVVLVVGGELWPIIGSRTVDPTGVAWSTTFAVATLVFAGIVPAVLLLSGAAVVSGLISRKAPFRWVFNAGQYALSLVAAWCVLVAFDRDASVAAPWSPGTGADLVVVLLAAAAYFVVNELLVTGAVCALTGTKVVDEVRSVLRFEIGANGAQLALAPLVAVVMQHAPVLTLLGVIPVAAVHRSASAERESEHAAAHDDLTRLANRKRFVALADEAIEEAARTGGTVGLLVVDLDRFKEVNDVLGHPVGDRVLVHVAARLRGAVRDGDVVARLGGDEFAVLARHGGSAETCTAVADRLRDALEQPITVDGHAVDLGASIGIATVPEHADDFESLFSRADVAMFAAKRDGAGTRVYSPDLDAGAAVRLGLLGALRRALDSGGIEVEYQPKVAMDGGAVRGVEALVRWRTESGAVILPDEFVPVAEQSGLMSRLTFAVLDQALQQCAAWGRAGMRVPVAVNVSLRDVLDPHFAVGVAARLVRFGVLAPMLTLEITERVLADDLPRVSQTLGELRELGVRLSLDDFGTGWSSLVLLRHLPVSEVKLDRSFVSRVLSSHSDSAIVRAVTDLAHDLGLDVVAEGVEDPGVWEALAELGCDSAQGWHVAHAMPPGAVTSWLAGRTATEVRAEGTAS